VRPLAGCGRCNAPMLPRNTQEYQRAAPLITIDRERSRSRHRAIQLSGVVRSRNGESLFVAVELDIFRYSPRVPAGAVSAEWHRALGDGLAVGTFDSDRRIQLSSLIDHAEHDVEFRVGQDGLGVQLLAPLNAKVLAG
jgi:hypothetical protein